MKIILIPGLWLDEASWDTVAARLRDAGHRVQALTLPGVGGSADDTAAIGIDDWVEAAVAAVDADDDPVVVVGHSGGGNVAWAVADRRPDRVARVVLVDTIPPFPGGSISEFEVVDGVVPFPGWDFFDEPDVGDLDADVREREAARAQSVPARVPTDGVTLSDPRRFAVPVTVLSGSMDEAEFRAAVSEWGRYGEEFSAIADTEVVRLGTGHWPQFSRPDRLAAAILEAIPDQ